MLLLTLLVGQLGIVLGSLLGGAIAQYANWRWCRLRFSRNAIFARSNVTRLLYQPSYWRRSDLLSPIGTHSRDPQGFDSDEI